MNSWVFYSILQGNLKQFNKKIMELVATIVDTKQIGMDEWKDIKTSKVFPFTATIQEIDDWAKSHKASIITTTISFTEKSI